MKKSFLLYLFLFSTVTIFSQASMSGVVINEISPRSSPGEMVELYNPTGAAVDIGGWEFYDNIGLKTTIPGGTMIPAGGFLKFAVSGLNDTGDQVLLYNPTTTEYIGATYDNGSAAVINSGVLPGTPTSLGTESFGTGGSSAGESYQREPDGSTTFVVKDHTLCLSNLPVELLFFSTKIVREQVVLTWATASEIDNDYFQIEHSSNGIDFFSIDKVIGAGTTFEEQSYQFNHSEPTDGVNFYRLKQVDFDGDYEYSRIISVNLRKSSSWNLFPTQSNDMITLDWSDAYKAESISIFNLNGKMVYSDKIDSEQQSEYISIANFPSGGYFLKMQSGRSVSSKRFFKIK